MTKEICKVTQFICSMLEGNGLLSPTRFQMLRKHKFLGKALLDHSQTTVLFKEEPKPPVYPFPMDIKAKRNRKIKVKAPQSMVSFNVCRSKDVFVFARKQSISIDARKKDPSKRQYNSQEKVGLNTEVFLPSSPGRFYRIIPRSSFGRREDKSCRKNSSSQHSRSQYNLQPEPWQFRPDLAQFDHLF